MTNDSESVDNGHFDVAYSLTNAKETLNHYKNWAATYDSEVSEQNGYAQPKRVAETLKRYSFDVTGNIFDAGCGSGLSGEALAAIGCKNIVGCDFSPEMLAKAEEKQVYNHLFKADLNQPLHQLEDTTYDAVVAVGVFSFGHVLPEACDELLRITKKGGLFIIALNNPFWQKGDLRNYLDQLENNGMIETLSRDYGDHLPGHDVMGWVIAVRKT